MKSIYLNLFQGVTGKGGNMTEEKTGRDEKYLWGISKCIVRSAKNYDTVQCLLEFLNLNSVPGIPNLFKCFFFRFKDYPPLKHPPTKPPEVFDKDGFASVKEYLWHKGQDGEPRFIGKISEYLPRLKDFIKYFDSDEYSFSQHTPEQFKKLYNIWESLVRCLSDIAQANTQKERDDSYSKLWDFVKERLEDYKKGINIFTEEELTSKIIKGETLIPYISPPVTYRPSSPLARYGGIDIPDIPKPVKSDTTWEIQEINALILNFWIKHKNLLPLLRQCRYCGTFLVIKQGGKKGRPNEYYCGGSEGKCSKLSNKNTRDYDKEYKKNYRDEAKKDLMEDMLKEIMNTCYVKKPGGKYKKPPIDKKEAEEVYKRIPRKNKKDINILKQTLINEVFYVL